jgi:hypothetical protein
VTGAVLTSCNEAWERQAYRAIALAALGTVVEVVVAW